MRFSYFYCVIFIVINFSFISCAKKKSKQNFEKWYSLNGAQKVEVDCKSVLYRKKFSSKILHVSGLSKSMLGDMSNQKVEILENDEELIWISACNLKIRNNITGENESQEFLCHSIINYAEAQNLPWKILTIGTDKRIFTLSQGANSLQFPKGFALPMQVPTFFSVGSQVLNLNHPNLKKELKYEISISYFKNKELCKRPKALYQQAIFVTKKVAGPEGGFFQNDSSFTNHKGDMDTAFAQCGISFDEGYNPYLDPYGRKYTGHWTVAQDSIEVLKTNVTPLMNLKYDTRIHYIVVHVHPFAHSLELIDKTTGTSLFKAKVTNQDSVIGISRVDSYSSENGIPVYVNHEYQLISTYLNPDKRSDITAMATMFLYLREGAMK